MIHYEIKNAAVAVVTWDLPDRPVNVMNDDSLRAYAAALERAFADPAIKGVVVTSAKRDFVVGADLAGMFADKRPEKLFEETRKVQLLLRRQETGGKPVCVAMNGSALGGGLEIALACHRRIAANNPKLRVGLPEVTLGLLPGAGGTQRLPRLIGIKAAVPLLLEGKLIGVQEAQQLGIVDETVEPAQLLQRAIEWVMASGPDAAQQPWDRKGWTLPGGPLTPFAAYDVFGLNAARLTAKTADNLPAPRHILSSVYEGCQTDLDSGLKVEVRHFISCVRSTQSQNLIRTSFFGMADAAKLKRRPVGHPTREFTSIGVVGTGAMARGIAQAATAAGLNVVLVDPSEERAGYDGLGRCQLAIVAPEGSTPKWSDVVRSLEKVLPADAIIALQPDFQSIATLAKAGARPENVIGMHFFAPVERSRMIEVVRAPTTSEMCVAHAMDFAKRINKIPVVVNDSPGFYSRRLSAAFVNEGLAMVAEGILPALIENAARQAGMPMGPLALADELSFETLLTQLHDGGDEPGAKNRNSHAEPVMRVFVERLRRLGKQSGAGFYDYDADQKRLWQGVTEHYPHAHAQPSVEELKKRFLYVQALEAVRCLEENVLEHVQDADIGALLGCGFPAYAGGPISLVDTLGTRRFTEECEALAQQHGDRFAPPALLREKAREGKSFYA